MKNKIAEEKKNHLEKVDRLKETSRDAELRLKKEIIEKEKELVLMNEKFNNIEKIHQELEIRSSRES